MNKKFIVGNGFIAKNLAQYLKKQGHYVVGLDKKLKTGDPVILDLNKGTLNADVAEKEWSSRIKKWKEPKIENQTPWQEIFRNTVGQLDDGACINSRGKYLDVSHTKGLPRDSH